MAGVLAHPLRLAGSSVALVDDTSDAGLAQELAVLMTTRRGERPMLPSWGVTDPTFDALDVAEVNGVLQLHGPDTVEVTDVLVTWDGTTQRAEVRFTRDDDD